MTGAAGRRPPWGALLPAAASCALLLLFASCAHRPVTPPPSAQVLTPVSWDELGSFEDDMDFGGLAQACARSLDYYGRLPASATFAFGARRLTASDMSAALRSFLAVVEDRGLSSAAKLRRIRQEFVPLRSVGSDGVGRVLFTGYYEPLLEGRDKRDDRFRYPIYRRPDDLVTADLAQFPLAGSQAKIAGRVSEGQLVPYFTRGDIDGAGALAGKGLELFWFDDPVDIFFLQVQGSGRVRLEDGREVRVQYDAANGQPYRSLGRYMLDKGLITRGEASLQGIRAYLQRHPAERQAILNQNPSYTFFRLEDDGPFGNIDVALTPGRSIATDARVFPKGALCLIRAVKPRLGRDGKIEAWEPFTRFVCNQDTGGAITGPGRVDLFWGAGPEAELAAGNLQHPGELFFLLPATLAR